MLDVLLFASNDAMWIVAYNVKKIVTLPPESEMCEISNKIHNEIICHHRYL